MPRFNVATSLYVTTRYDLTYTVTADDVEGAIRAAEAEIETTDFTLLSPEYSELCDQDIRDVTEVPDEQV